MATKKISINKYEEAIKASGEQNDAHITWNGLDVVVKRTVTLNEMRTIIEAVSSGCFDDKGDGYFPEYKDFIFRSCIIEFYTNIGMSLSIDKRYAQIYGNGLIQAVIAEIDATQLEAIKDAIDEKIAYRANSDIAKLKRQVDELTMTIGRVSEEIESVFKDVSKEDLEKMVAMMSDRSAMSDVISKAVSKANAGSTKE